MQIAKCGIPNVKWDLLIIIMQLLMGNAQCEMQNVQCRMLNAECFNAVFRI